MSECSRGCYLGIKEKCITDHFGIFYHPCNKCIDEMKMADAEAKIQQEIDEAKAKGEWEADQEAKWEHDRDEER